MSDIEAPGPGEVTGLPSAWADGPEAAFDRLLSVTYALLPATVKREWKNAKAWLFRELGGTADGRVAVRP